MTDYNALYSAFAVFKFCIVSRCSHLNQLSRMILFCQSYITLNIWPQLAGEFRSSLCRTFGPISITCLFESPRPISICQIVISGSLLWLIGRTKTHCCNQISICDSRIQISSFNGAQHYLLIVKNGAHNYVSLDSFSQQSKLGYRFPKPTNTAASTSFCVSDSLCKL